MVSEVMEKLLSRLLLKDDITEVGIFSSGNNLSHHLRKIEDKIRENEIKDEKKATFLKRTLSSDVLIELSTIEDYDIKQNDYNFIVDTLKSLYLPKKSEISHYLELLKIKQQPHESTKDFLSSVRVNGMKVLHAINNSAEKEKLLIMCFTNGLSNKRFSKILNEIKPKSLKQAFELIKNEKSESAENNVHALNDEHYNNHCQCESKFNVLISRINQLEQEIKRLTFSPKKQYGSYSRNNNQNDKVYTNIKCYNCQGFGHIAKNCRRRTQCQNCGLTGHISENCRRKIQTNNKKIRQVKQDESETNQSEVASVDILENGQNIDEYFEEQGASSPQVFTIQRYTNMKHTDKKPTPLYSKVVENWAQYIDGQGEKPKIKQYSPTLITNSGTESARNKPIITIKAESVPKNVLVDTGSDCNVIDLNFFKSLAKYNPSLKILPKVNTLSCANGSKLSVIGYTILNFSIGGVCLSEKFTIVDKIFPNIIIGMRTMIKNYITVVPSSRCVLIGRKNSISVPFVSRKSNSLNC